jgi:hypothetical protein
MPGMIDKMGLEAVACDATAERLVKKFGRAVRLIKNWRDAKAENHRNVFVFCSAMDLPEAAHLVSALNRHHQLRGLFVREDADLAWLPQLLERANLRTIRSMLVHGDNSVPRRVFSAWQHGAQNDLIANATVAGDKLLLISCAFERVETPFAALAALKKIPQAERGKFNISGDGSYIHWPESDIHLDLDAIKSAVNPEWRLRVMATRYSQGRRYGQGIAQVRKECGLQQRDIPGLSERQIRRIESGSSITASALRSLAAAHKLRLDEYLSRVAEAAHVPQKARG